MPAEPPQPGPSVDATPPRRTWVVELQNPCRYPEVRFRHLRPWVEPLVAALAPAATSLTLRFVSDREMRRLNATWRHKDKTTDVLSFPGDLDDADDGDDIFADPEAGGHLGDIAISVPTARRQAEGRGGDLDRELRILILHGILHCLGYDHETDDGTMERLEQDLRAQWIDHG